MELEIIKEGPSIEYRQHWITEDEYERLVEPDPSIKIRVKTIWGINELILRESQIDLAKGMITRMKRNQKDES